MADLFKISNELSRKHDEVETSIGKVLVFGCVLRDSINVREDLNIEIKDATPIDYLKTLIKYICCLESEYSGERPQFPTKFQETISLLNEDDLNIIAECIISHSDYPAREIVTENYNDAEGKKVAQSKKGELKYPKKPEDNNIDYLHKLKVNEEKEWDDRIKKMNIGFSDTIKSSIGKIFTNQNLILDSFKTKQDRNTPMFGLNKPEILRNPLVDKIDTLNDNFEKIVKNNIEMFNVQLQIATELSSAVDAGKKSTKTNLSFTRIVLVVTIVSLIVSVYGVFKPNNEVIKSNKIGNEMLNKFDTLINVSKNSVANKEMLLPTQESIELLTTENTMLKNELNRIKEDREVLSRQMKGSFSNLEIENAKLRKDLDSLIKATK